MSSISPYLGKTVKSRQDYWYEVYESSRDDADIHLVPVDTVPGQHVSAAELEERMENGWELVYDGTTRIHEPDDEPEYEPPFDTLKRQSTAGGQHD